MLTRSDPFQSSQQPKKIVDGSKISPIRAQLAMSDREESPDWLREFQAPTRKFVTLSSTSDSSPAVSLGGSDDADHSHHEEPETLQEKRDAILIYSGEDSPIIKSKKTRAGKTQKDSCQGKDTLDDNGVDSPVIKTKKTRPSKTQKHRGLEEDAHEEELGEDDTNDKQAGPLVSSRLPLVFPDKVHRSKALVECDGDSIDLSGDVGAVGRVVISNGAARNHEMLLDLKGTIYKSTIVPSRTFCIVSVGQSEAKIEAIMNDFIKLEPQSNVFEAETMIEGTLDGYSFDSDEEGEKVPKPPANQSDQNEENGDQANPKTKRKAERLSGKVNKKAKAAVRPSKTVKKTKKSKEMR